jgi:hypothetical protein
MKAIYELLNTAFKIMVLGQLNEQKENTDKLIKTGTL